MPNILLHRYNQCQMQHKLILVMHTNTIRSGSHLEIKVDAEISLNSQPHLGMKTMVRNSLDVVQTAVSLVHRSLM